MVGTIWAESLVVQVITAQTKANTDIQVFILTIAVVDQTLTTATSNNGYQILQVYQQKVAWLTV
jgi:hypothetical protein